MYKFVVTLFFSGLLLLSFNSVLASRYSRRLCSAPGYTCIKIKRGDTWARLWPNPQERRIVMRVNRMNRRLWAGLTIAVPNRLRSITHMDISPMPYSMHTGGHKLIVISMQKQAFGAYDEQGYLVHWGPISGGKGYCPDVERACNTPRGNFRIFAKGTKECESKKYPVPDGGAPMPFCMYFHGGYAMHASDLPGYHASHGCVRMFYEDAEWLNKEFINLGRSGTRVKVI